MKLITGTLFLVQKSIFGQIYNYDPTQSCSSKTDMAGFECCNGDLFYNCIPTDAVTGGQCNCNSDCVSNGDCCNDQTTFCVAANAAGPTNTPVHMTLQAPSSAIMAFMYDLGLDALVTPLFDHGCFCPLLSSQTIGRSSFGGEPIDELDQSCKEFHNSVACLKQPPSNA